MTTLFSYRTSIFSDYVINNQIAVTFNLKDLKVNDCQDFIEFECSVVRISLTLLCLAAKPLAAILKLREGMSPTECSLCNQLTPKQTDRVRSPSGRLLFGQNDVGHS